MIPSAAGLRVNSDQGLSYYNSSSANRSQFEVEPNGILDAQQIGTDKNLVDSIHSKTTSTRELSATNIEDDRVVTAESELRNAIGGGQRIILYDDITLTSPVRDDFGSADIIIDLNGHSITRADGVDDDMLNLTTTGVVWVCNGFIDGNRPGQTIAEGGTEIFTQNAGEVLYHNISVIDNLGFALYTDECDTVLIDGCTVRSYLNGSTADGPGLDGVHINDAKYATVSDCNIVSGDDAVAIMADDRDIEGVSVSGGTHTSPYHANGVKVVIRSTAAAGREINSVNIDTTSVDTSGSGIIVIDLSGSGSISTLNLNGAVTRPGDDGVYLDVDIANVDIDTTVEDSGGAGISSVGSIDSGSVKGTITNAASPSANIVGGSNINIDLTVDGKSTTTTGLWLENLTNCRVSGTITDTTSACVRGQNSQYIVVSGLVTSGADDFPIKSGNGSDQWTVVGCSGQGNSQTGTSLSGTNTISANNFGN